jgi:hypothetical protein
LSGFGEKKSSKLKPFHCGNLFFLAVAQASVPLTLSAAAAIPVVAIKSRLFMGVAFYGVVRFLFCFFLVILQFIVEQYIAVFH